MSDFFPEPPTTTTTMKRYMLWMHLPHAGVHSREDHRVKGRERRRNEGKVEGGALKRVTLAWTISPGGVFPGVLF